MENKKIMHWLEIKQQCGDAKICVRIPAGFTIEQADEIEARFNDATERYGDAHNGDYGEFDIVQTFESVLDKMGIEYKYPVAEHTIYV